MKDLVKRIIGAIVDDEEAVQVSEINGGNTCILEVRVAKSDLGKVIGKQGATATAIRNILHAASGKDRRRYVLEVIES